MGAWSGGPFGNDTAADWAWELDDAADWQPVRDALDAVLVPAAYLDDDLATIAIAAAETVAHGLGSPTQSDSYTESVSTFVARVGAPPAGLAAVALTALDAATSPESGLAQAWRDPKMWVDANEKLRAALKALD